MSEMTPTVSVIVPNYNHARFLPKRIESVLRQTYQDFEMILLDDCSPDDSRTILSSYASDPRVRIDFNEKNSGSTYKQWNKGVRMARGKYVWIAESDDYADERLLERLVHTLDGDPNVTFAFCRSRCVTGDDGELGFADKVYFPDLDSACWTKDFIADGLEECKRHFVRFNVAANASSVLFRKAVYDKIGGPDIGMGLCADWKFWVAMALEGKVAYVAEALNSYRFHTDTVRSSIAVDRGVIEHMRAAAWILAQVGSAPESVLRGAHLANSRQWVPAVLSMSVPLAKKREIVRSVKGFDPHPTWSVLRWCGMKVAEKLWKLWCPILDLTYKARHATGLTSEGLVRLKARIGLGKREPTGAA